MYAEYVDDENYLAKFFFAYKELNLYSKNK